MNGRSSSTIPPHVSQLGHTPPPGRRFGLTEIWTGHSQTAAIGRLNLTALAIVVAALALAGCGGDESDPFAEFSLSNAAAVVYADLAVIVRGKPGPRLDAANEQIYPATLDYVDALKAARDEMGDDAAFRDLSKMASSVEGWCDECSTVLQREIDGFDD